MDEQQLKNALPTPNNTPYLIAVVIMLAITVASITVIAIARPDKDNSSLYVLIIGSVGPTTLALLAFMKAQETHLSVNSRLEQFIRTEGRAARSEGQLEGLAQGRVLADQRTDDLKMGIPDKSK